MKIFISADLEGIAGIVHEEHVSREGKEHERARKLMTQEVNAAIEGALTAGAKEIVVNDSHGTMRNIIPEELNENAVLVTGSPKPLSMMQGIDETFDAVFFIGYHAMASGFPTILGHTYHGRVVYNLRVNNRVMGETGINAAVAGYYNVPVVLVTGDETITKEATDFLGKIETVAVKKAVGRYAAQTLTPPQAKKLIKEAATKALKNLKKTKPFKLKPPITLEVDFVNTGMTEMALLIPEVKQIASRTISYRSNDLITAFKTFKAITMLAGLTF